MKKISVNGDKISVLSSLGRDSLSVVESRNVKNPSNLRALKKEDSQSNEYYLRAHFYAINGIGYGFRQSAWENFDSLFLYVKEDIQQRFPQDTISVGLIFNKTSLNKFTDFIQSIYNMMSETDLTSLGLGFLVYTSYVELVNDLISENNSVVEEIIRRRDELWSEYIVQPNEATLSAVESALNISVENKARSIVLGHSQGGMYTYKAFNSFPDSVREHFYSLNVAVPTANNPDWYLINDNDWIVNAARLLLEGIPVGESNGPVHGEECECHNFTHHAWNESYYKPCLLSYKKINTAIENAFRTVPYWGKEKKNAMYQLVWYNSAAQTTIEIAKANGSFVTLGTYHGYHVTDPTVKTVPYVLLQDGVPVLRVRSYHHESWWGPYLSTDPGFCRIEHRIDCGIKFFPKFRLCGTLDDGDQALFLQEGLCRTKIG